MTPSIEISTHDFTRLQSLAEPFIDTPVTVISRLLDEKFESKAEDNHSPNTTNPSNVFYGMDLPPLRHTKFLAGQFAGQSPKKKQWNSMVETALKFAMQRLEDERQVNQICGANLVNGKKTEQGYAYLSESDFSYQRVSAEEAAKIIVKLAEHFKVSCEIEFEWRNKEKAHMPNEKARINVVA